MGTVTECSKLYDFLYVGSFASATPDKCAELGLTWIVDASNASLPEARKQKFPSNVQFMQVEVEDTDEADIGKYFDEVADLIHHEKERGGRVLVHCAAGVSRAPALVIAYCVKYEDLTLRSAYLFVKKSRRRIGPNYGFWRQLISFEETTKGEASVKFVKPVKREIPDVYLDEWKENIA